MSCATYAITLTFFVTTPGVAEPTAGGFPAISAPIGQFLLKRSRAVGSVRFSAAHGAGTLGSSAFLIWQESGHADATVCRRSDLPFPAGISEP